jgi:hypothetical protein
MAKGVFAEPDGRLVAFEIFDTLDALREVGFEAGALSGAEAPRVILAEELDEFAACKCHTFFDASFSFRCHSPPKRFFMSQTPVEPLSAKATNLPFVATGKQPALSQSPKVLPYKAADAYNRTRLTPCAKKLLNSWLAETASAPVVSSSTEQLAQTR